ncbi:hypothetical protein OHA21_08870 [Actinoplanes sp. NBC_00393]|uniref:hypothetical protein n=1 Tax=Actinoplanes sp. NBC_00393 TaxID=2975953 RepID=UPI002E22FF79
MQFGETTKDYLLTGVSAVTEITAAEGGPLESPQELRSYEIEVVAQGPVPSEYVYDKLSQHLGTEWQLPEYGRVYHLSAEDKTTVDGPGRFITFDALETIAVPFTYDCGGATTAGTVKSWRVPTGGVIECGVPRSPDDAMYEVLEEVARMRC